MLEKEKIERINSLAKKKKEQGLTTEEILEQKALREEYLDHFRKNLRAQLEQIEFVDEDGGN